MNIRMYNITTTNWSAVIVNPGDGKNMRIFYNGPDNAIPEVGDTVFWGSASVWYDETTWVAVLQQVISKQ